MSDTLRRPLVAGNWKMNGDESLVQRFKAAFDSVEVVGCDVVVCPPAPYMAKVSEIAVQLGAQNISEFDSGAHTGEVSAAMLVDCGCKYVIVGHSERRSDNYESNQLVAAKTKKALEAKLTPILCVGESEEVRDSGALFDFIAAQLDDVIVLVGIEAFSDIVIAYEPIWAIGTGKTATPEQAQEVHGFIRAYIANKNSDIAANIRILYGGSVKASNAQELFAKEDVDGGLIGGASLKIDEFISICQAAVTRG